MRRHSIPERGLWLGVLVLILCFGAYPRPGLSPHAALLAGVAENLSADQSSWQPSVAPIETKSPAVMPGQDFVPFVQIPPYWLQASGGLLKILGHRDGAARALGGLPTAGALLILLVWMALRLGWLVALGGSVTLAFLFWPFINVAAGGGELGAFGLALVCVVIASFENQWLESRGRARPLFFALLVAGLMLSTAIEGVWGILSWVGLGLSLAFAFVLSPRSSGKILLSSLLLGLALLLTLAPLGLWAFELFHFDGVSWFIGYFYEHIFHATLGASAGAHGQVGPGVFLRLLVSRVGWMIIPAVGAIGATLLAPALVKRVPWFSRFRHPALWGWCLTSLAVVLAYWVPLSWLGHTEATWAWAMVPLFLPPLAAALVALLSREWAERILLPAGPRWAFLLVLVVVARSQVAPTQSLAYSEVGKTLESLPDACEVVVPSENVDAAELQAYALWYWHGRPWRRLDRPIPSRIAVPHGKIYWDPHQNELWGEGKCAP